MKKFFKGLALVATLLFGAGIASAAVTKTPITIGNNSFTFGGGVGVTYYYTATSDGTLTFNTDSGDTGFLYTAWVGDAPNGNSVMASSSTGNTHSFEVVNGVTYYCWVYYGSITVNSTSFVADNTQGSFAPLQTSELQLGKQYTKEADGWKWATEGSISGPNTCYTFTPSANGTFTMTQSNSDTHVYSAKWNQKSTFVFNTNIIEGNYPNESSAPFKLTYQLEGGKTYYIYALTESADLLTYFTATFQASGETILNAELNVPFKAYNQIYKYVPQVTGVMTVQQSTNVFGLAGSGNSFVYTSSIHSKESQILPLNTVMSSDNSWQFNVTAGQPVYFYQSGSSPTEFTITSVVEQTTPVVTLTNAYPFPGEGGLDDFAYVSGITLDLAPMANVNVASAKFTYLSATDGSTVSQPLTIENSAPGKWLIIGVRDYYIEAMRGAAKPASMCQVVLEGITLQGRTAETTTSIETSYVNCNGNSIAIQYYIPDEYGFQLSKAEWPDVIYATWPEEGQSNGIATLIFNNNIKEVSEVQMLYGHQIPNSISGTTPPTYIVPHTIEGNTLTLDFTAAYEDENVIPDGNFSPSEVSVFLVGIMNEYGILWGDDGGKVMVEYIPFNSGAAPEPAPTMDKAVVLSPEDGNTYAIDTEFEGFIVSFWDAEDGLSFVNSANTSLDLYVGGKVIGQVPATIDGMNMTVKLGQYAGKNAEYMIWIPQGFVQNKQGEVNPGQGVSCKVLETNAQYTLTPVDGAELIDNEIKVTYANSTLLVNDNCPSPLSWANNRYMGSVSVAGDSFVIPLDLSVMEEGEYTLIIPETYFVINASSLNPEIEATYMVTSNGMTADFIDNNEVYTVYNMNGVKLLETADKSKLNTLGKGLYIINGKKVIVK